MYTLTLIGMPGSGKSAVGAIIARRLGWHFLDTDKLIERRQGLPLQALIDVVGDLAFRRIEEETVLNLAITGPTVISTGGSVVYSEPAMRRLAAVSRIVFLDAGIEAIRAHIGLDAPRGIVGLAAGGLEALYRDRVPRYRRHAEIVVSLDDASPEDVATSVICAFGLTSP